MKRLTLILFALSLLAITACSPSATTTDEKVATDSVKVAAQPQADTTLTAKLVLPTVIGSGMPIEMTFTVYNKTDSTRTFCKWHTPFEPLMSKYLDVTTNSGKEVAYKGPMAKRMMPPPADSYINVKPGDSLSVTVDLLKAYDIKAAGNYIIKYNAESISGLKVIDSVRVNVRN